MNENETGLRGRFVLIMMLLALSGFFIGCGSNGSSSVVGPSQAKGINVELTRRQSGEGYGGSAYSFRYGSKDYTVHHNYVDLVFNNCGLLHVSPHGGLNNSIVDLGNTSFDEVNSAPARGWKERSIEPIAGHVYVEKVDDGDLYFHVKFVISRKSSDSLMLTWSFLEDNQQIARFPSNKGDAGTMGLCGGSHSSR